MDPRALSDAELERRLREAAYELDDAELRVRHEAGGRWSAAFVSYADEPDLAPDGAVLFSVSVDGTRREALEQLALALETRDEYEDWRGRGRA